MSRRDEIERLNAELSKIIGAKDVDALVALYEEDAWLLPPGAPLVQGRDKILARFNAFLDTVRSLDFQFDLIEVIDDGDVVVDLSRIVVTAEFPSGESRSHTSKHLVVWREQADGSLKMAAELVNRDAPTNGSGRS